MFGYLGFDNALALRKFSADDYRAQIRSNSSAKRLDTKMPIHRYLFFWRLHTVLMAETQTPI
jgi:hypothetical protein